jgi:hypothetical protein
VDGKQVGVAKVPRTMPFMYSADEGVDVGTDNETPVTEDYKEGANKFTGRIVKVTIQSGDVKLTDAEKEELAKGTADAAAAHQ